MIHPQAPAGVIFAQSIHHQSNSYYLASGCYMFIVSSYSWGLITRTPGDDLLVLGEPVIINRLILMRLSDERSHLIARFSLGKPTWVCTGELLWSPNCMCIVISGLCNRSRSLSVGSGRDYLAQLHPRPERSCPAIKKKRLSIFIGVSRPRNAQAMPDVDNASSLDSSWLRQMVNIARDRW